MADTARRATAAPGGRGSFMLGQKLRQAATRVYQVLSQEKHAMSDSDDDYDYGAHDHGLDFDSLRLALELSVEQQLRNGYVLDYPADTYVNPTTTVDGDDVIIDADEAQAVAAALRDEARLLREAQDTEYARALAQDQMRERSHQQREAWRKLHRRVQKQRLRALRARVVPEPEPVDDHDPRAGEQTTSSLVLRFPDGRRAERRFRAADRLADVHTYVEALALEDELKRAKASEGGGGDGAGTQQRELSADDEVEAIMDEEVDDGGDTQHSRFHLVSSYPRRRLADLGLTLREAGLCPSGVLFVQPDAEL